MLRHLLEFSFDPSGADAHDMDVPVLQFPAQRAREVQHVAFTRAVNGLIRHRLPGGVGTHVDDAVAALHIRQADVAHGCQGQGVQPRALQHLFQVTLREGPEHTEPGRVDQQMNQIGRAQV